MIKKTLYALLFGLCVVNGAYADEVPGGAGGAGGLNTVRLSASTTAVSVYGGSQNRPAMYRLTCSSGDVVCVNNPFVLSEVDCTPVPLGRAGTSAYTFNTTTMGSICSTTMGLGSFISGYTYQ